MEMGKKQEETYMGIQDGGSQHTKKQRRKRFGCNDSGHAVTGKTHQ